MKTQRIKIRGRSAQDIIEEYNMLGYEAEVDGDEVVVYYGRPHKKKHKKPPHQPEKWSKRERNFGFTRG